MNLVNKIFLLLGIIFCNYADGAKILGLFNTPSRSHVIVHDSLMQELARRGHEVTVVSEFPPKSQVPSTYRFVHVSVQNEIYKSTMQRWLKLAEDNKFSFMEIFTFLHTMTQHFENTLYHPEFMKLKNETFDLVVLGYFMNEFQIGVAAHFKCPIVISTTSRATGIQRRLIGNPNGLSFNPSFFLGVKGSMTFSQRIVNFLLGGIEYVAFLGIDYFTQQKLYEKNFPPEQYPSYEETKKNISLVLINQHFSEGYVETSTPGLVEIGGMHIKPPSPLPKDIQQFLDEATDGAIFFSLGSNVKSSHLSREKRDAILYVFSQLKQRVVWKWEDDQLPSQPANVLIRKWLPQNDILGHPNIKLFISHCGLGSVLESKYHGVPILAIPVFADQPINAKMIESEGWGQTLTLFDINELTLSRVLNEMLSNTSYIDRVKTLSTLYKDRPLSALDTAAYWVEYVIRHNGAKHMQSPGAHLNFFQYYSLDVIAIIFISIYVVIKIIKWTFVYIFRKLKSVFKSKKE